MGVPALDILGWVEPPNYNISNHRLVWSIKKAADRGAAPNIPALNLSAGVSNCDVFLGRSFK